MGLEVGDGCEGVWGAILEVTVGVGCWIMFILGGSVKPQGRTRRRKPTKG